jgi:1,4-dihydroxy-2-naphthoate octaprenyltransferase
MVPATMRPWLRALTLVFMVTRAPFLLLALSCAGLGAAVAVHANGTVALSELILVLVGAVCAHASVNAINEYVDFCSGLDAKTRRTKFSGGSGALPAAPCHARAVLLLCAVLCLLTTGIGVWFVWRRGWGLLPIGMAGMLLVLSYTPWLVRRPWLCTLAPGVGFGPLMVCGSEFALSGTYSWSGFLVSLPVLFLVSNLLLLNQIPDIAADRGAGRRTLPIVHGTATSMRVWWLLWTCGYAAIVAGVLAGLPRAMALGLAPGALAVLVARATPCILAHGQVSTGALAANAAMAVLTPALMALGILLT